MKTAVAALFVAVVVIISSFGAYELYSQPRGNPSVALASCKTVQSGAPVKTQTTKVTLGAVTEYKIPGTDRWPNAVTNSSDGSVWFAEQEIPGLGHLYPSNGTLVEYAWPNYPTPTPPDCIPQASSWGIAIWQGRIWAADEFGNMIQGLKPSDGSVVSLNVTGKGTNPFWLAVSPDGYLWYSSNNFPPVLGRIAPNLTVQTISLTGLGTYEPLQLEFVNSSLAYLSTINYAENSTTHSCVCDGHIYSFDPTGVSSTISPTLVGGRFRLIEPTSVSYSNGAIWVAQHDASSIQSYNLVTKTWTIYPTSTTPWLDVTLPLVIESADGNVWFNEHYANKIALLNPSSETITEYSESSPPASNYTMIQNDESIALSSGGLWFTSISGNYVGFVSKSYDAGFSVSINGTNRVSAAPGGNVSLTMKVGGAWSSPMEVGVSDSENHTSFPGLIRITPAVPSVPAGIGPYTLGVRIGVGSSARPGEYTAMVTVTDGLVQKSAYIFITVT